MTKTVTVTTNFPKLIPAVVRIAARQSGQRKRQWVATLRWSDRPRAICRPALAGLLGFAMLLVSSPTAPAAQDRPMATVTLTITHVKQISNVDATKPGEFYAKVKINGQSFPETGHREDDGDVRPNWTFTTVVPTTGSASFSIDIWDHDFPDADDHCDASPKKGRKRLSFYYNFTTDEIGGDVTGNAGSLLHARGAGNGNRVEVWCRIAIARAR